MGREDEIRDKRADEEDEWVAETVYFRVVPHLTDMVRTAGNAEAPGATSQVGYRPTRSPCQDMPLAPAHDLSMSQLGATSALQSIVPRTTRTRSGACCWLWPQAAQGVCAAVEFSLWVAGSGSGSGSGSEWASGDSAAHHAPMRSHHSTPALHLHHNSLHTPTPTMQNMKCRGAHHRCNGTTDSRRLTPDIGHEALRMSARHTSKTSVGGSGCTGYRG